MKGSSSSGGGVIVAVAAAATVACSFKQRNIYHLRLFSTTQGIKDIETVSVNLHSSSKKSPTPFKLPPGKNLLKTLAYEESFKWDTDGRSSLFRKGSEDYIPTGSLLKAYYYPSSPLPEDIHLPLRKPMYMTDENEVSRWKAVNKIPSIETLKEKRLEPKKAIEAYKLNRHTKDQVIINPIDSLSETTDTNKLVSQILSTKATSLSKQVLPNTKLPFTFSHSQQPHSFYGILTCVRRNAVSTTFILRNVIDGVGVEMTFQLFSPLLVALEVAHKGKQKRSKWYWLRDKSPKLSTFVEKAEAQQPIIGKIKLPPFVYLSQSSPSTMNKKAPPTSNKAAAKDLPVGVPKTTKPK